VNTAPYRVLLEIGDNAASRAILTDPEKQKLIGEAIKKALVEWMNTKYEVRGTKYEVRSTTDVPLTITAKEGLFPNTLPAFAGRQAANNENLLNKGCSLTPDN